MTLISAMKFTKDSGAIVADEQSTGGIRTSNLAEKVHKVDFPKGVAFFGGTGASDFLYDAALDAEKLVEENADDIVDGQQFAGALANILSGKTEVYVDAWMQSHLSCTIADLKRGYQIRGKEKIELSPVFQNNAWNERNSNQDLHKLTSAGFLVLTKNGSDVQIYVASSDLAHPMPVARPYECVGSGQDIADNILHDFFEDMTKSQRKEVHPGEGLSALLYATHRASLRNVGVGGTPVIGIVFPECVIEPTELECKYALDLSIAQHKGFLKINFARRGISDILTEGQIDSTEAYEKAMDAADDRKACESYLRGYKPGL